MRNGATKSLISRRLEIGEVLYMQLIFPNTRFKGLRRIGCQGAKVGKRAACDRVLEASGLTQIFRLEEASESSICTANVRDSICLEKIQPISNS